MSTTISVMILVIDPTPKRVVALLGARDSQSEKP
jgi:hypothetical protein